MKLKKILASKFEMKDIDETNVILGVKIIMNGDRVIEATLMKL